MLYVPVTSLVPIWSNFLASDAPGVSVTPGISEAEGSWVELVDGALITEDVYEVKLWISFGFVTASAKPQLLDIGVDEAAGTAYTAILSNLSCGNSGDASLSSARGGRFYRIPLFIKAGSSIAVRIQGAHATGTAVRVAMSCRGAPDKPHLICAAAFTEAIGTIANSCGTVFTPGATGAEGAWTLVGTTVANLWGFILSIDHNLGTITTKAYVYDLAYGDATNKVLLLENQGPLYATSTEYIMHNEWDIGLANVPAGTNIYVRGSGSGTVENFNCIVIGLGGVGHP